MSIRTVSREEIRKALVSTQQRINHLITDFDNELVTVHLIEETVEALERIRDEDDLNRFRDGTMPASHSIRVVWVPEV